MSNETIYYKKVGGKGRLRITRLRMRGGELSPTHEYEPVTSWSEARKLLEKRHPAGKVHQSADMFKVQSMTSE
jgi:hypothetical protein